MLQGTEVKKKSRQKNPMTEPFSTTASYHEIKFGVHKHMKDPQNSLKNALRILKKTNCTIRIRHIVPLIILTFLKTGNGLKVATRDSSDYLTTDQIFLESYNFTYTSQITNIYIYHIYYLINYILY